LGSPSGIGIIVVLVVLIIGAGIFINNYSKRKVKKFKEKED
jgi:hypothetical protein